MTRASVLVPTHDHASTLGLAVSSALNQTVQDLEVLIIGDGVTDKVRAVALQLERTDPRVRFLDFPKGANHGEVYRHSAIEQSNGDIIVYLCDDDLLMPGHVADMIELLHDHDLAQCLNGYADINGDIHLYSGSFDDPAYVARLVDASKGFNFVGITGTAHTREFYDRAGTAWETTPQGSFPDQHQWRRMLSSGDVRGATSPRMTVIGLPSHDGGRESWTPAARAAELERWAVHTRSPHGQEDIDRMVGAAAIEQLRYWTMRALIMQDDLAEARELAADAATQLQHAEASLAEATASAAEAGAQATDALARAEGAEARAEDAERRFATVIDSRWWRLGRRLRPGLSGREA